MVYGAYNELVTGAFVNQLISGGPHIVLVGGWATLLKKYEFVSWDDYSQLNWKNTNHQATNQQ